MNHLFLASALLATTAGMLASCSQDAEPTTIQETDRKAHVRLSCALPTVTTVPMRAPATRAALTANGTALTDIYILDYDKTTGALLQVLHQTSTATDFAEPDLTMDYGTHTLRVIATRSTSPTLLDQSTTAWPVPDNALTDADGTLPVYMTADKTSDTFAAETDVTVSAGTDNAVTLTLARIVAKLTVNTLDAYPDDCHTLDVAIDEYNCIMLDDLSVIDSRTNHRITDVAHNAGKTGYKVSYFVLAPTDGYTTDITITPTRTSGDSYPSVTVPGVLLERNKVTTITGCVYTLANSLQVQVTDAWNPEGNEVHF